jgi:hypothetical protein
MESNEKKEEDSGTRISHPDGVTSRTTSTWLGIKKKRERKRLA